jgi:hypothetical protein
MHIPGNCAVLEGRKKDQSIIILKSPIVKVLVVNLSPRFLNVILISNSIGLIHPSNIIKCGHDENEDLLASKYTKRRGLAPFGLEQAQEAPP